MRRASSDSISAASMSSCAAVPAAANHSIGILAQQPEQRTAGPQRLRERAPLRRIAARFAARASVKSSAIASGVFRSSSSAASTAPARRLAARRSAAPVTPASRKRAVEPIELLLRLVAQLRRPVERLPVVRREQAQAHGLGRVASQQIADEQHVADGLRHLRAVHEHEAVVQPVARVDLAGVRAGALRGLVLVVREHEIDAARVDVDRLARDAPRPSSSTRCANPGGPGPTGSASRRSRAVTASRARSRPGPSYKERPPRARPRGARPGRGPRDARTSG